MYAVPAARTARRPSRLWHCFWLLVLGVLSSSAILITDALTAPQCAHGCPPFRGRPLAAATGELAVLVGWPVITWLAALGYGWRWAGRRPTIISSLRVLAAPPLYALAVLWWQGQIPRLLPLPTAALRTALGFAVPLIGLLFITHLDILLRPMPAAEPPPGAQA